MWGDMEVSGRGEGEMERGCCGEFLPSQRWRLEKAEGTPALWQFVQFLRHTSRDRGT